MLHGVVTGMETLDDGPYKGRLSYSIYSPDAEMNYGMPAGTFRAIAGETARERLANLVAADAGYRAHMAAYPCWADQFAADPGFRFFGTQIDLVAREVATEVL